MAKNDDVIEPIDASFDAVVDAILPKARAPEPTDVLSADNLQIVSYGEKEGSEPIEFRLDGDTQSIWATQSQMMALFDTTQSNISTHLKGIFEDGELDRKNNIKKIDTVRSKQPVTVYSLDTVISVGYRVNSKAATKFRQWATQTLKAYVEQGYVINEKALRDSPEKLNKLAAQLRALRSEEKQVYAKVRECFKISASDYQPGSATMKKFYALLQDKFYHAVTGMESSKLILDRVNHRDDHMGVQTFQGSEPTLGEATTAKNLLDKEELYRLHILSEQFLLYAEATALAGRRMTMASLHKQLDRLLDLNDYPVFEGWKVFLKDEAERHARLEHTLYKKRKKIEAMGIEYDEELLAAGEYDDILIGG